MNRYRLLRGKLRLDPDGEWVSAEKAVAENERLREALFESYALNVNWASVADEEMLEHLSEYRAVIAMAKQVLAADAAEDEPDD